MIRLGIALVFCIACWSLLLGWGVERFPDGPPWYVLPLLPIGFIAPLLLATLLVNKHPWARWRRLSTGEFVAELEAKGKLEREAHVTGRVLKFEDMHTSSLGYLVESVGKGTLLLHGQYLYSYEPSVPEDLEEDEDPEPRTFPTERFELLRERGDRDIIEIARAGAVVEPEEVPAPDDVLYRELMVWPMDGRLIVDPDFDTLRARLLRA
jgi:hypothetical protein